MAVIQAQIKSIVVDPNIDADYPPVLTLAAAGTFGIFEGKENEYLDAGTVEIPWLLETGFTSNEDGSLYTFDALQMRIALYNNPDGLVDPHPDILVEVFDYDDDTPLSSGVITPGPVPRKYFSKLTNFVSEHLRIRLSGYNQVLLNRLVLFVQKRGETRPR